MACGVIVMPINWSRTIYSNISPRSPMFDRARGIVSGHQNGHQTGWFWCLWGLWCRA